MLIIFISLIAQFIITSIVFFWRKKLLWSLSFGWNVIVHNIIISFCALFSRISTSGTNSFGLSLSPLVDILGIPEYRLTGVFKNFIMVFGYDKTSILYIWLVVWVSSFCLLTARRLNFKKEEYIFIVMYLQACLITMFSADNLWIFALCQVGILPVCASGRYWFPVVKRRFSPYILFFSLCFVTIFLVFAIWGSIIYSGNFSRFNMTIESGRGFYFAISLIGIILCILFKIPYYLFHEWIMKKGGSKDLKYSIMSLAFLFEFGQIGMITFLMKVYSGPLHVFPLLNLCTLMVITTALFCKIKRKDLKVWIPVSYWMQVLFLTLMTFFYILHYLAYINTEALEGIISLFPWFAVGPSLVWYGGAAVIYFRKKQIRNFSGTELLFLCFFIFFLCILYMAIFPNMYFLY